MLHIPDIGVAAPLHLLFRLVDRLAETVIYLFMDAVLIFVPDQIRHIIDRRLKILAGLPEVFPRLAVFLPFQETKPNLLIRHRNRPYVLYRAEIFRQKRNLIFAGKNDRLRLLSFMLRQFLHHLFHVRVLQIGNNNIRFRNIFTFRSSVLEKLMCKMLKRGHLLYHLKRSA